MRKINKDDILDIIRKTADADEQVKKDRKMVEKRDIDPAIEMKGILRQEREGLQSRSGEVFPNGPLAPHPGASPLEYYRYTMACNNPLWTIPHWRWCLSWSRFKAEWKRLKHTRAYYKRKADSEYCNHRPVTGRR